MREKLIELIDDADMFNPHSAEFLADHLLANGVIVPPVKVGDKVYENEYEFETGNEYIIESKVTGFAVFTMNDIYNFSNFGKTVFLSREDAEKALKLLKAVE